MDLDDILSNPAFYILAALGLSAEIIGWKMSKSFGATFPLWQFIILMVGTVIASAVFAGRE